MVKRLAILDIILISLILCWEFCPFQLVIVAGASMEPTLRNHELILINKQAYKTNTPTNGDVVVFKYQGDTLIKRVVATSGEVIAFRPVTTQQQVFSNPFQTIPDYYQIPNGKIYVLGDNREHSYDSRDFGTVPIDSIMGKMVLPKTKP